VQTRLEVVAAIAAICNDKDLKSASKAAISLGYLAAGDRSPALLEAVASALLSLSSKKGDDLHFAVGEALCFAYAGAPWTAESFRQWLALMCSRRENLPKRSLRHRRRSRR